MTPDDANLAASLAWHSRAAARLLGVVAADLRSLGVPGAADHVVAFAVALADLAHDIATTQEDPE